MPEVGVFLEKGVLKICCKFKGEQPCQSLSPTKLQCNFSAYFQKHLFIPLYKNTYGGLLLKCRKLATIENIPVFPSSTNLVREVKNVPPNFERIT